MPLQAPRDACPTYEAFGDAFELRDTGPGRLAVTVYHNTRHSTLWRGGSRT